MPRKRPTIARPDETGWARPISAATPPPEITRAPPQADGSAALEPNPTSNVQEAVGARTSKSKVTGTKTDAVLMNPTRLAPDERVSIQLHIRLPKTNEPEIAALLVEIGLADEHLRRLVAREIAGIEFDSYATPSSEELARWKEGRSVGRVRVSFPAALVTDYRQEFDPINVMPSTDAGDAILAAHASELWERTSGMLGAKLGRSGSH